MYNNPDRIVLIEYTEVESNLVSWNGHRQQTLGQGNLPDLGEFLVSTHPDLFGL
jgi:hypothetical protein